jgi:hypothetical protein
MLMDIKTLKELEIEQKYLFHGTGNIIEEFEPRQAYNNDLPDGKPAVFVSPFLDYAIFMAIFNEENCPKGYQARVNGLRSGNLTYEATKKSLDQLNESTKGYVYVFNKSDFEEKYMSEWASYKKVVPIVMFEITRKDFLPSIKEIIE